MGEYTGSVIRLSIGFFFLFAAFNTVQTLEASILTDKSLAFATLSTIYGVFTFTNIAAPKIVSILGPRLGMFLGSLCYIALVAANLYPRWYTLLPASAAVGVGAAVLWTSQGIYMSRSAAREAAATGEKVDDVTSRLNGLFFAMFQFNGALGLGVVGLILQLVGEDQRTKLFTYIFLGFTVAGCIGASIIFTLKDAPPLRHGGGGSRFSANDGAGNEDLEELIGSGEKESDEEVEGGGKKGGGTVGLLDTLALVGSSRRMQLILPAVIFNGASLGFCLGAFTTVFAKASDDSYIGLFKSDYVGFYGATFYLTNSFFSYMWGKVLPVLGRRRVFYVSGVAMALWMVLVTYVCAGGLAPGVASQYKDYTKAWSAGTSYAVIFSSAALFALGDSVLESQLPAIVQSPTFFPLERERDAAISNVKMWQSLGYCLQFGLGSGLSGLGITASAQIQTYVLVALFVLCYGGLYTCDWYVASFDAGAKDQEEEE